MPIRRSSRSVAARSLVPPELTMGQQDSDIPVHHLRLALLRHQSLPTTAAPISLPAHPLRAIIEPGIAVAKKTAPFRWSIKMDRALLALARRHDLDAIADGLQRTPAQILRKARTFGIKIKQTTK
jgi:hypothetical protein